LPEHIRRVLYRLPELAEQPRVCVVEGEKDADRLWSLGVAATTTQGGAAGWRDAYADQLVAAGAQEVVLPPDNDQAGERYSQAAARACLARGLTVRMVRLPDLPHKGDVSDWLDAGHTVEDLKRIIAETPHMETVAEAPVGAVSLATAIDEWLAEAESGRTAPVARTPFPSLNHFLVGGFAPGELIYLGARPGVGKTALGLEIARSVATDGASVLVISREMVVLALARRLLAQTARVSASSLRRGRLSDVEWALTRDALPKLRALPLWLTDQFVTAEEIQTLVRGFAVSPPLGLLVVDYLQLVRGPAHRERRLEVEAVSQTLKGLAVERRIPVLCLSSLSRPAEGKAQRPTLASLRESGELEHDADVVLLLHREPMQPETECVVAKNRDGRTGVVRLRFSAEYVAFDESEERQT
jgi:replicative DNA helicase